MSVWNDVNHDPATNVVADDTIYQSNSGQHWKAISRIRFASKTNIQQRIRNAGLDVDQWRGDWRGSPWTPASAEIIPLGRLFA